MEIDIGELIVDEIINIPDIELDYIKETPETEEITILPTKEGVSLEGLFHKVTIPEEPNFIEENIKQGISIFGKEGTYSPGVADLSGIGTTVIVEAQESMLKGDLWEGIPSENKQYSCGMQQTNLSNRFIKFSKDLSVACGDTISYTAVTYQIAFYDTETMNYSTYGVDVSHIEKHYSFTPVSITEDGTLIFLQTNNSNSESKIIAIEVDKENKTAVAYECELPSKFGYNSSCWIQDCVVGYNNGHLWYLKYNKSTHVLDLIKDEASNVSFSTTPNKIARIDNKTFIGRIGSSTSLTLVKFIINENDFTAIKHTNTVSYASYAVLSYDGRYISCRNTLYQVNLADLSLTLLSNDMGTGSNTTTYPFSGGKLIADKKLYDISNINPDNPTATLLYTHSSSIAPISAITGLDIHAKYLNSEYNICYFPDGENIDYVVKRVTNNKMVTGKIYGIASKQLSLGDKNKSQLLFIS